MVSDGADVTRVGYECAGFGRANVTGTVVILSHVCHRLTANAGEMYHGRPCRMLPPTDPEEVVQQTLHGRQLEECQKVVLVVWRSQSSDIFGLRCSEHITPALISLHWLRIIERISFKLAVLTHRAIHGARPSYFQSCFTRVADMPSRRWLRLSGSDRLHVPIIRRSTVSCGTFTASGAAVRNLTLSLNL